MYSPYQVGLKYRQDNPPQLPVAPILRQGVEQRLRKPQPKPVLCNAEAPASASGAKMSRLKRRRKHDRLINSNTTQSPIQNDAWQHLLLRIESGIDGPPARQEELFTGNSAGLPLAWE